jgi:hypothetical protein
MPIKGVQIYQKGQRISMVEIRLIKSHRIQEGMQWLLLSTLTLVHIHYWVQPGGQCPLDRYG